MFYFINKDAHKDAHYFSLSELLNINKDQYLLAFYNKFINFVTNKTGYPTVCYCKKVALNGS